MPDQENEPVIASTGKVERVQFNAPKLNETPENTDFPHGTSANQEDTNTELTADQKAANVAAGKNEDGTEKTDAGTGTGNIEIPAATTPLTDDEIKAEYEKRFPTQAALSDEEKQKQADAFEKRMLDLYVETGGKIEEFALLKHMASQDLTELSKAELTKELKVAGITDPAQIEAIQKERYFQKEQAEIDEIEDEEERALAQKKFDYGKAKFESKGKVIKENAEDFLNNLKEGVNQKDFFTKREADISSNVDEHFSKLEKKMTLQLGKVDDTDIPPVEYEVPQEVIDKARTRLNTPEARKQLLFNADGSINHTKLSDLVLKAEMFESGTAAKTAYLTGAHREVEKIEKILPYRSASALGTGGTQATPDTSKKVASFGKPQRVNGATVRQ